MSAGVDVGALIVDDRAYMRSLLRREMEEIPGCLVVGEGTNGLEGLALARHLRPELVVMDIHMPLMGGLEALPLLRNELPGVQIVLVTTLLEPEVRCAALAQGAVACLEKGPGLWKGLREIVLALVRAAEKRPA